MSVSRVLGRLAVITSAEPLIAIAGPGFCSEDVSGLREAGERSSSERWRAPGWPPFC